MTELLSEGFYKAVFDGCSDAIYVIDPKTSCILEGNPCAWEDLGLTPEELLGHSVLSLQSDVVSQEHWELIAAEILKNQPFVFIGRHRHKNGSSFPVEVYTSVINHQGRELFVSIARNLTRTSEQREEFRSNDARLTYALNEAADGMWDWNVETDEVFFSPQMKKMLKYLPNEMEPHVDTWAGAVHPKDVDRVIATLQEHLQGQTEFYEAEYQISNRDGDYLWVRDRGRVCRRDAEGKATRVVGMLHDITRSKMLEEQLRQQASYDDLTGLLNRRAGYIHFRKQLSYAQRYEQQFSLCLLDLDHFKSINDAHGHLVGDAVLKHFVEILSDSLRQSDTLMRWGGEEFLLLLPKTDAKSAKQLVVQLKEKVQSTPMQFEGRRIAYTFSGGLAAYPKHSREMDGLISCADDALYSAKEAGRNLIIISSHSSEVEQQALF